MIEGFENALGSFNERQKQTDAALDKINDANSQISAELDEIDYAIGTIEQHILDRDNLHREELPPEAFQGYGGQTPQYDDDWAYGPTEEEDEELEYLFKRKRNLLKRIEDAEIPLL